MPQMAPSALLSIYFMEVFSMFIMFMVIYFKPFSHSIKSGGSGEQVYSSLLLKSIDDCMKW
uniref:ATP synthase F0 subunit 8 n=1 Tax=Pedicinus obtusus TaxID=592408 RepID=A0A7L9CWG9_9NEOP|nr:ATP synthase F0 subunit 8 [Pedicinus obtusus]